MKMRDLVVIIFAIAAVAWFAFGWPATRTTMPEGSIVGLQFIPFLVMLAIIVGIVWFVRRILHSRNEHRGKVGGH